jgi:hypothetical protein
MFHRFDVARLFTLICLTLFAGQALAKQDALLPLLPTDMAPGCGCNFTRYQSKGEAPIFRWLSEGKKQAMVRTADKMQVLELRQEKHIPERAGGVKPTDRMVLFVANGEWQIQVLGNAMGGACRGKRDCKDMNYQGRLLVQQGGGARTELPVEGKCSCPAP